MFFHQPDNLSDLFPYIFCQKSQGYEYIQQFSPNINTQPSTPTLNPPDPDLASKPSNGPAMVSPSSVMAYREMLGKPLKNGGPLKNQPHIYT